MFDLFHEWSGDLAVGSTGDIALVTGFDVTQQRVYRRLLTNPGDYLWNLDYGGGLAGFVGLTADPTNIEAVIRNQLEQESAVAPNPAPNVEIQTANATSGYVVANIAYTEVSTGMSANFSININK